MVVTIAYAFGLPGGDCRSSLGLGLQGLEGSATITPSVKGWNKRPAGSLYDKWFEDIKHSLVAAREGFTLQNRRGN